MKAPLSLILFFSMILSVYSQESNPNVKKWTLRECVDYAIENNITVKQSENNIALSEVDKRGAIGNFIPTLNMNTSTAWNAGLTTDVTTGVLINQTVQVANGGISSGVDIYRGLRNQNELRKAELSILASQYQLDLSKDNISLFVINAYLEVLFSKEAVNVAIPQVEITQDQLARTKQLVEAGTLPRGDLLDVQA
ncbi:TolC family protein, partial [Lutimonas sp.]|uniref:TolC family protein n=1 Tax=Lutimonas sp. TaxID=1872403 RepID=UPI003C75E526